MTKTKIFYIRLTQFFAICIVWLNLSYGNVLAGEYKSIMYESSSIGFSYKQMGVGMDGQFKKFTAQININTAKLQNAKASFEIDLTSIDTGSGSADDEVQGKDWFNTKLYPKATFISNEIKSTGANQFEVTGTLSIKGQNKQLKFPIKFTQQGGHAIFSGTFIIRRADFLIGEGAWSKFDVVANEVNVAFNINAQDGK